MILTLMLSLDLPIDENVVIKRELQERPDSSTSYQIISSWIKKCVDTHINCRQPNFTMPTRLLNISQNEPYLEEGTIKSSKYTALSHRWGSKPGSTTTLGNLNRRISISHLPKTFLDAITVSKRLGIGYIWIDSLCIIQDSKKEYVKSLAL